MKAHRRVVLAVDPSLRATGYAVVGGTAAKPLCLEYGVVKSRLQLSVAGCLLAIHEDLDGVIRRFHPQVLAIESTIYVQSYRTAIVLGAARGAALLAAARHGLEICEFAPRKIKRAVVGRGAADKKQVAYMVRVLYRLAEEPPPDAADALATALAYLQNTGDATGGSATLPS